MLEGIFDIYLPDIKYCSNSLAQKYSNISEYVQFNQAALIEMFDQVGLLKTDADGIAQRGIIVRHLVLPGHVENSKKCLRFIAEKLSPDTHVAIMSQYFPAYEAKNHPVLGRRITPEEYQEVIDYAEKLQLNNAFIQPLD